jgi:S-adenosylmethionine:tRNA ribosyltransferase-isomerase
MLKVSDFDYHLPQALIAQYPLERRDSCRLLVLDRKKKSIEHRTFRDLREYLKRDDLLLLNDTKVLPCRLEGRRRTGGRVEVLLLKLNLPPDFKSRDEPRAERTQYYSSCKLKAFRVNSALRRNSCEGLTFSAWIKPARVKIGEEIIFNGGSSKAVISSKNEIRFDLENVSEVYGLGTMPLPPYIKRKAESLDANYYQTVYAKACGSVAAPTAGLHFTEGLLSEIESAGVNIAYVTLHVGLGTFAPIKTEDITCHRMEPEYFKINEMSVSLIDEAVRQGRRIISVGTTSLRVLETFVAGQKEGYTDLYIYPGYKFKLDSCLLTNFHLPKTTLFVLVCALATEGLIRKAYQQAIEQGYRFYSYGDAMLIL